ncbi:MAG: YciI family protein [Candidatus Limnocylindrales bacterium]
MRYLALIYTPEPDPATAPPVGRESEAYAAFTREARERDIMRAGEALQPTTTATTVRVRDGRTMVSDGPYAETKEALGGFYLFECSDIDTAIELAAKIPGAAYGAIELRPIWEFEASMPSTDG